LRLLAPRGGFPSSGEWLDWIFAISNIITSCRECTCRIRASGMCVIEGMMAK
jgi:hypothetical protein